MRKTILLFATAALAATLVWSGDEPPPPVADDLVWNNRLWIDRVPKTERDKIEALVALDEPQIGIFQKTSAYEGDFSVFAWRGDGAKVGIEMLQSKKRHTLRFKLSDRAKVPFDYTLKVRGAPRGATVYYSMEEWVIDGELAADPQALASWVRARLSELD